MGSFKGVWRPGPWPFSGLVGYAREVVDVMSPVPHSPTPPRSMPPSTKRSPAASPPGGGEGALRGSGVRLGEEPCTHSDCQTI